MEHWILECDAVYEAIAWPFATSWDEFVREPKPLVHVNDDFGRFSPSDGIHESPVVPAHLPRAFPQGKYQMAIYHDTTNLYAFLESEDGPVATPLEELHQIPHLGKVYPSCPALALLSNDQRLDYRFSTNRQGGKHLRIGVIAFGPRRREPPAETLDWDLVVTSRERSELACWRIARASLADMLDGNRLRLSISRIRLDTLEQVGWVTNNGWSARPDEMGMVKLVDQRTTPAWPTVRRVDLLYNPVTERGRFQIHWNAPYDDDFKDAKVNFTATHAIQPAWGKVDFRLNHQEQLLEMADTVETGELPIADGDNCVEISPACAPIHRFFFEKWSGNRLVNSPLPPQPPREREWVMQQIRTDCEAAIRENEKRRAQGAQRKFLAWESYRAAALGRVHHYLWPDPRLLEVVREVADYTLTLQREDGTFAGLHMEQYGSKPAPWAGGAFDSGPVGELWLVAHRLLKDAKYLEASHRLVQGYKTYRIELNHNYAAFALCHLSLHYRLTRDPVALEHALYYAKHCVATNILPLGFHRGHNFYSCYGNITLRGMAMLAGVLPESVPYRAKLHELCIRMLNQLIVRQQPDGRFDSRVRYWIGNREWLWGLFPVAFLLDHEDLPRFDAVVQRMLHAPLSDGGYSGTERLGQCDFALYYAHRDRLLAGEKVDFMTLL